MAHILYKYVTVYQLPFTFHIFVTNNHNGRQLFSHIIFSMLTGNMNTTSESNYININKKKSWLTCVQSKTPSTKKKLLQHKYIFVWFSFLNTLYKTCFLSTVFFIFIYKRKSKFHHPIHIIIIPKPKKNSLLISCHFSHFLLIRSRKMYTHRFTRVALFLCGKCLYTFLGLDGK